MFKINLIIWALLIPLSCFGEVIEFGANESPPFWSKKMHADGMCGEILQEMSVLAAVESNISFKPLNRLIEDSQNNDLGNPSLYLQHSDFASIIPIAVYRTAFYYYKPNHPSGIDLQSLADLKQYKIGILKGTLVDRLAFEQQGIHFETSYKQQSIFKKLKLGRIDLALVIDLVGQQTVHALYPNLKDQFSAIELANSASPIAIMLNEEQPNAKTIGAKYQQALKTLIDEGRYQQIIKKHTGQIDLASNWREELERFSQLYNFVTEE